MATSRYVDVWCDHCGNWTNGDSNISRLARISARRRGWLYVKIEGKQYDLCDLCAAEYRAGALVGNGASRLPISVFVESEESVD